MYEVTPMAGRQQGTLKGWLFLPDVVSSLEPEKAISGMGAPCTSSAGSMVDPRAASRPLVSAIIAQEPCDLWMRPPLFTPE
jgi:hypothetical protein